MTKTIRERFDELLTIQKCNDCNVENCNRKKLGDCYVIKQSIIYDIESCIECFFKDRCPIGYNNDEKPEDEDCGEYTEKFIYISMQLNGLVKLLYPETIKLNGENKNE
jgi:hypothetical protein